jgi:hypothetical protein
MTHRSRRAATLCRLYRSPPVRTLDDNTSAPPTLRPPAKGSDAKARHIVRRDDPADIIRDDMGAGESTVSRWRTARNRPRGSIVRAAQNVAAATGDPASARQRSVVGLMVKASTRPQPHADGARVVEVPYIADLTVIPPRRLCTVA